MTWRPQLIAPDDEMVLECAINAQAEVIVTFNVQDFLPAALQFGIDIIQPGHFVRSIRLVDRMSWWVAIHCNCQNNWYKKSTKRRIRDILVV